MSDSSFYVEKTVFFFFLIVHALYGAEPFQEGHFNHSSYLYLLAPISLLIINPIGFLVLEYSKQRQFFKTSNLHTMTKLLFKTLLNVIVNPVGLPTIAGILVNIIRTYGIHHGELHPLPKWLEDFLQLVGRAYVPCALFSIGLFMVGKIQKISFMSIVVSSLLVFAKRYVEL